jgi:hypothetical protein
MTITLNLAWWQIPTGVTILAMLWAFFWPADDDGFLGGITRLFMCVPALFVSLIAWVIAAVVK